MSDSTAFAAHQYEAAYPDGIENSYWNLARNRVLRREIERVVTPGSRLLDIGCGRGIVTQSLRAAGLDVWGCDLASPPPICAATGAYLHLAQDAFELPAEFRESIDAILLLDVLEHLPDPEEFLHRCRAAYPHVGTYVITLPARQELWSAFDEFHGHVRRYDRPTTIRTLRAAGLDTRRIRYFFHAQYLPLLWQARATARSTATPPPSSAMLPLHRAVGWLLAQEPRLVPGGVVGSSLIAIGAPIEECAEERADD